MILFAGDPHGNYSHLYPFVQKQEGISLVILGDLQLNSAQELDNLSKYCDIWFIHGNHDSKTVQAFDSLWGTKWKERNIHGRVVEIEGIKIAGLGGVFRGQIWMPPNKPLFLDPIHYCQFCNQEKIWRGGLPLRHRTSIFPSDIEILGQQCADILISHEAPFPHPSGFDVINQLAEKMGVKHIFHGHHHNSFNYDLSQKALPYNITSVGFRSVSDINGNSLLIGVDDRK